IYNQRNHNSTTPHHPPNTRLLCECELYTPTNYDNDPEMKRVMQQFVDRTTQRFHEYDERMKTTRQKCKDKCDKEIQNIILKDKLEKELAEKFVTLHTDIQSDAIPTCVCEKSLADKVEKNCMKCAQNLGGIVAPSSGVLVGIAEGALYAWKPTAIAAAMELAKQAGAAKGLAEGAQVGIQEVMKGLLTDLSLSKEGIQQMGLVLSATNYKDVTMITEAVYAKINGTCLPGLAPSGRFSVADTYKSFCDSMLEKPLFTHRVLDSDLIKNDIETYVKKIVSQAKTTADAAAESVTQDTTATLTIEKTGVVQTTYMGYQTAIIVSIAAIVVIVLVMVIIYLILRYRRKKKMKKKLQYIKLLEE
ncbi:surface antigen, partial [Plasmodium falciparum UGT5.1]